MMSYMVSYELGPYFRQMIIRDIIEGHSYYTLHFDETISPDKEAYGSVGALLVREGQCCKS